MITSIEQLPVELWISIFSYFEAHELFRAFENLNSYFNHLLASDHLTFHVRLGKIERNPHEYSLKPYWSHSILHRIVHLRPIYANKCSHIPEFLRWHADHLIQLKSLKIKLRQREIAALSFALPQLISLEHLFLKCVPNQNLLESILSIPNLRRCHLIFLSPLTTINTYSNQISSNQILDIQLHDTSYSSIMILLLSHMPKLKKLQMNNLDIYLQNREWIFFNPTFILSELHFVKLKCSANYSSPLIFQCLHQNLPCIKSFELDLKFDFINENLLDHLINHWLPIFQSIERFKISIQCQHYSTIINEQIQLELNVFQENLLTINEFIRNEYHESFFMGKKMIRICFFK